jgi:hypothetical protein
MEKRTPDSVSRKPSIPPPRPDFIRTPTPGFGWLDDRLLKEGWLQRLGPEPTAVLVLLALAADRHGASFYGRERMAARLSIDRDTIDRALDRLLQLKLVEHRPWRAGNPDGIWQIMHVPQPEIPQHSRDQSTSAPISIGDALKQLGIPRQRPRQ